MLTTVHSLLALLIQAFVDGLDEIAIGVPAYPDWSRFVSQPSWITSTGTKSFHGATSSAVARRSMFESDTFQRLRSTADT